MLPIVPHTRRHRAPGRVVAAGLAVTLAISAVAAMAMRRPQPEMFRPLAAAGAAASAFPAPERPISAIVAPRWTAETDRDDAGEFQRVAVLAGLRPGLSVADIGAGDGYYVARLSAVVGPTGRVFGQDILPRYLAMLAQRVRDDHLSNVTVALGEPHDPRLPDASVDVALMIHMYHEITQPFGVLWNLATAMRPGGRLVILDLERPTDAHGTPVSVLRCELTAVGYREQRITPTGEEEYVAVFTVPTLRERPSPADIRARLQRAPCRAP